MNIPIDDLKKELKYKTSRSGGKGGQNVNKVSTKVELLFDFERSVLFTEEEKEILRQKLSGRLSKDGEIQIVCQEERSQLLNKEKAIKKLTDVLHRSLQKEKPRKATKPTKTSIEKRLTVKKQQAEKKSNRKWTL